MCELNCKRGDIFYIEDSMKEIGSEQSRARPGIIVSNNMGNKYSRTVEVVYLTTANKANLPTHVDVMCKYPSTALCESVYTVDKQRLLFYIKSCNSEDMKKIDEALLISLGLNKEENE